MDKRDKLVEEAKQEAHRAMLMSYVWWAQLPIVCIGYPFAPSWMEPFMLSYLAGVSIIANAVSYASKAKGAEAKAAGYENP